MLTRLTPFATAAADQPIFKLESRHIIWARDAGTLIRTSMRRIGIVLLIVVLLSGGVALSAALSVQADRTYTLLQTLSLMAFVILVFGLFSGFLVDLVSVAAALDGINGDLISGRWDLLKLANIREGHFTVAKHGIAQLRAWKSVSTVIGVRAAGTAMLIVSSLAMYWYNYQTYSSPANTSTFSTYSFSLSQVALQTLLLTICALVFVLEPIWRMRTMTAVGLMVSAHTRSPYTSPLAAFGITFVIWMVQVAIMGALACGLIGLVFPALMFGAEVCAAPLLLGVITAGFYGFYEFIKNYCLRRVAFRLASLESAP